jgi:hypothetical protein
MITGFDPEVRRAHERGLLARHLDGLRRGGATQVPSIDAAFDRYRLFSAEAWDATAMTTAWPGLQAPENAEAGRRRACTAVEDLDTEGAVNDSASSVAHSTVFSRITAKCLTAYSMLSAWAVNGF